MLAASLNQQMQKVLSVSGNIASFEKTAQNAAYQETDLKPVTQTRWTS